MIEIKLTEKECDIIRHCLHLEYSMMEFRRGFRKPDAKEKYLVRLWKRFSDIKNKEVNNDRHKEHS